MRNTLLLLVTLAVGGCAAPASDVEEGMLAPPSLMGTGWSPTPGVEWGNLTGVLAPGRCESIEIRDSPPVLRAWWLHASPGVTFAVANWTQRDALWFLCGSLDTPGVRTTADVERLEASVELAEGHDGHEFAFVCEGPEPCEVSWWSQSVRHVTDADGTRRWASEPGPSPQDFRG